MASLLQSRKSGTGLTVARTPKVHRDLRTREERQRDESKVEFTTGRYRGKAPTADVLAAWAKSEAKSELHTPSTLIHLQIRPGAEGSLVGHLAPKLKARLIHSHELAGPVTGKRKAAATFQQVWDDSVGFEALGELIGFYQGSLALAIPRAPMFRMPRCVDGKVVPGEFEEHLAKLETRPAEIERVVKEPYRGPLFIGRVNTTKTVGELLAGLVIRDTGTPSYVSHPGSREWLYWVHQETLIRSDQIIKDYSGQVAAGTQAAAGVLPFIVKIGAFSVGMSARLSLQVGAFLADRTIELADGRSPQEVLKSGGQDLLIQLAFGRLFGGGQTAAKAPAPGKSLEEQTAAAVRNEIRATDDSLVAKEVNGGRARVVRNDPMAARGYTHKVDVVTEGQAHTYYRNPKSGHLCRHSDLETEICELDFPAASDAFREKEVERIRASVPRKGESAARWVKRTTPDWDTLPEEARNQAIKDAPARMATAKRRAGLTEELVELRVTRDRIYGEMNEITRRLEKQGTLSSAQVAELMEARRVRVNELGPLGYKQGKLLEQLERAGATAYERARAYSYSSEAANVVTARAMKERPNGRIELVDEYSGRAVKNASIDHVVPVKDIAAMKCFDVLFLDDFRAVLSNTSNLRVMEYGHNSAKGERSWAKWDGGKAAYGAPVQEQMIELDRTLRKSIQADILKRAARTGRKCT